RALPKSVDRLTRRWIQSAADERAARDGCRFDERAADHAASFFPRFLRHSKGRFAGQPFELLDFQRDQLVKPLFGWKLPGKQALRRFRKAYVEWAKKNGKSTIAAGLALYLLTGDGEPGPEVYCAAVDRDQASIVFRECAQMVIKSPELKREVRLIPSTRSIVLPDGSGRLQALSADVENKEGKNIHALIFDELHAQTGDGLWNTLRYAFAARQQPLLFAITTAGFNRRSLCWQVREYAQRVHAGKVHDNSQFTMICAAADGDDWSKESTWRKANPSLGVTINLADFRADFEEARHSPARENAWRRYRINQWVTQESRFIPMEHWKQCAGGATAEELRGRECMGGLDLASTRDLTSLYLLFPDGEGGFDSLVYFWCPLDSIRERSRKDQVPYDLWHKAGLLRATEGTAMDYAVVRRDINQLADIYGIKDLAVDRLFQGAQLSMELAADGLNVIAFGQGFYSMAAPTKEFERLVVTHKLRHTNHEVLNWMAENMAVSQDPAGNLKPDKKKSSEKIDGVVAGIMALGRAMVDQQPEDPGFRFYSDEDLGEPDDAAEQALPKHGRQYDPFEGVDE
ncbi:MAG TPA: terminase TerL endonuclease subunit, partial [Pirellulales bacterium]